MLIPLPCRCLYPLPVQYRDDMWWARQGLLDGKGGGASGASGGEGGVVKIKREPGETTRAPDGKCESKSEGHPSQAPPHILALENAAFDVDSKRAWQAAQAGRRHQGRGGG